MRRVLLALALAAAPCAALAQQQTFNPSGSLGQSYSLPPTLPTTATNGTVAVANTFQVALAADNFRHDCTIYSAAAFSISPGPSPSAATAILIPAGGSFKCSSVGAIMSDQINITAATTAAYVVWRQ